MTVIPWVQLQHRLAILTALDAERKIDQSISTLPPPQILTWHFKFLAKGSWAVASGRPSVILSRYGQPQI